MMTQRRSDSGFALILAILALLILTFLGLTLATTTSTELQIATNYRWGQQALYDAELGIELARNTLLPVDFAAVLPAPRLDSGAMGSPPAATYSRTGMSGEASRNFENNLCDVTAHEGYGAVLDISTLAYPFQNLSVANAPMLPGGQAQIPGTVSIWVRRPQVVDSTSGIWIDSSRSDQLVLTAEGTAPYQQAGTAFTQQRRAVRVIEVSMSRVTSGCGKGNQEGNSPEGAGAETCVLTNTGVTLAAGAN